MLRLILMGLCVIGTVWPWLYFSGFFVEHGADFSLFIAMMTPNLVTKGLTADICLSILAFWIWSFVDGRRMGVRNWWLIPIATLCVGLSLALPLYLLLRERKVSA